MYKCTELCLLVFLNNQQIWALTWVIRLFLGETLSSFTPTPPKCISRYQQIYCCGWEVNLQRCLTFADCRPQTTECRPQTAGCKLKDTKNLPNKGDTIKNITSCESEKVAWEQGWYFAQSYIGLISKMLLAILHRRDSLLTHPAYH